MNGARDVIIILGKTGFGKSTWLRSYVHNKVARLFIFDPFADIGGPNDSLFKTEYLSEEELLRKHEAQEFTKQSQYKVGSHNLASLDLLGAIAFTTGKCFFCIEECGVAFYKGERIPDWLSEIIFLGRHRDCSVILTAQRAASIPIELRSQASRFISFRQTERRDLEWTRDYIGEHFESLATLEKFECIDADANEVTRYFINPPHSKRSQVPPQDTPEDN